MPLKDKILKDIKEQVKARDMARVKVLRFLSSALKNKEIELRPKPLTEQDVLAVIKKQIKQTKESLEHYKSAGYTKQASEDEFQLSVLQAYLPKALSEEELKTMVQQSITETKASSPRDMGQVIKAVMAKAKGSADGKLLSQIVRQELAKL